MILACIAMLLAAGEPAENPTLKLVAPGLQIVGLDPKFSEFLTEHAAQQMKLAGVDIVTQREMQSLLGLERQKQLLGCSEASSSCMAELASALGADGVLLGDVARFGSRIQLNLKVIASTNGSTVAAFSDTVASEDAALEALGKGATQMAKPAAVALHRSLKGTYIDRPNYKRWSILPAALTVAFGAGAAILLALANQAHMQLITGMPQTDSDGRSVEYNGQLEQGIGAGLAVAAGVALVAVAVLLVTGVAIAPTPTGTAGVATWEWP